MTYTKTVSVGPGAVNALLVSAGEGNYLITNLSLTTTLYIGEDNAFKAADTDSNIPVFPNGSIVVDGSSDVYGTASANIQVSVLYGGVASFRGITQALGALAIPSVRSPNFASGISGWSINQDGSAEFNNLTLRGNQVFPNGFISNGDGTLTDKPGFFLYSGTPAVGNLVYSCTASQTGAGHDKFSNAYLDGDTSYDNSLTMAVNRSAGVITYYIFTNQPNAVFTVNASLTLSQDVASGALDLGVVAQHYLQINDGAGRYNQIAMQTNGLLRLATIADPTSQNLIGGGVCQTVSSGIPISLLTFTAVASWQLVAGYRYRLSVNLSLAETSNVGQATLSYSHSTTATFAPWTGRAWYIQPGPAPSVIQFTHANAVPNDGLSGVMTNGQTMGYELEAQLVCNGSGTLTLSAAQVGGGTYTVQNGSYGECRKVA
jgi:hypothetical protein